MTIPCQEFKESTAEIERLTNERPHTADLLRAFGPLLMAQRRWLAITQDDSSEFPIDPIQYQDGIPLVQQGRLFLPEDRWQETGLLVAEAIAQGFPHFARDMQQIVHHLQAQRLDCFRLCTGADTGDRLIDTAQQLTIETLALHFFQRCLTRWMLTQKAQTLKPRLASLSWNKGYCPVCGCFPQLAIIREHGQRWLRCSTCSHEWMFPRLTCPYCGHEDPEETQTLFVEGWKEEFAFICGECSKYLLTSTHSGTLPRGIDDLLAFTLIHLDFILQEEGFSPMAVSELNTFGGDDAAG